jgi:hypothetical protein
VINIKNHHTIKNVRVMLFLQLKKADQLVPRQSSKTSSSQKIGKQK